MIRVRCLAVCAVAALVGGPAAAQSPSPRPVKRIDGAEATRHFVEQAHQWAHDEAIWNSQYFTGAMEDQLLGLTGYVDAVRFAADLGELALADTDEGIAYLSFGGVIGGLMFDQLRYMQDRVRTS